MNRIMEYLYKRKGVDMTWKEVAPLREYDSFHVVTIGTEVKINRINNYQHPKYPNHERD